MPGTKPNHVPWARSSSRTARPGASRGHPRRTARPRRRRRARRRRRSRRRPRRRVAPNGGGRSRRGRMAPSVGSGYVRTMSDPTSLPNFPPPASEHPLRGRVLDILLDEGFQPDIDSDGDVAFKVQGQQLFVRCLEGDFTIMRVFGQWQIGDDVPQDLLTQLPGLQRPDAAAQHRQGRHRQQHPRRHRRARGLPRHRRHGPAAGHHPAGAVGGAHVARADHRRPRWRRLTGSGPEGPA